MKLKFFILICSLAVAGFAFGAEPTKAEKMFYRDLIKTVRPSGEFRIPLPDGRDFNFHYEIQLDSPKWAEPVTSDFTYRDENMMPTGKFQRSFWDKIFLKEGSFIELGGEKIPLTCIHVSGIDNRRAQKSTPLVPDLIMNFTFVANDWTCTGPLNPGWPGNGGGQETWETLLRYEVRDPTIMLPMRATVRFRQNEFRAVLVK